MATKALSKYKKRLSKAQGLYRPWGVAGTGRGRGWGHRRGSPAMTRRRRGGMSGEGVPARAFPSSTPPPAKAQGRRDAPDATPPLPSLRAPGLPGVSVPSVFSRQRSRVHDGRDIRQVDASSPPSVFVLFVDGVEGETPAVMGPTGMEVASCGGGVQGVCPEGAHLVSLP